jgi:type IV pilus assembly protein PilA
MRVSRNDKGFTLLELMVVVAIIAILAALALPSLEPKYTRAQIVESVDLLKNLKENINLFYVTTKKFPRDSSEAGIPKPEHLIGNYVERIDYVAGSFDIKFGSKAAGRLKGKILSIRPIVVVDSPESPISWVCGNASPPAGMVAVGVNKTNIENQFLPLNCY